MEESKKKIAAMTAVLYYLQCEEEDARYGMDPDRHPPQAQEGGFWSFSGRQSQMMLRSMAQMRLFPGWRG